MEGDWNWLDVRARRDDLALASGQQTSFDVSWLATVRGRAGLALDATLLYVTGGLAFGKVKNRSAFLINGIADETFEVNETKVGWTAGVGVEHMFSPHWTVRAEFRYVDLGTTKATCATQLSPDCSLYRGEFSNTLTMGLVGVDYKF